VPGGVVHGPPKDLRQALIANGTALDAWRDITRSPATVHLLGRGRKVAGPHPSNQEELEEGQRRPCCWPGCKHRDRTGKP
jgi:hypothetical protein